MGWNNQNVTSLLIINASGGFTGLFVYNPSPGPGNLIDSIAAQAGTDPYGNPYAQGITAYGPAAVGVSQVSAQCWGGGGGGAAGSNDAGGGGEYAAEPANTVVPGQVYTVVVGAAGAGGASGGTNPGSAGGNSSFSGPSATTVTAHAGGGGTAAPGTGGTGSTNTAHFNGGAGGASPGTGGGGGGGSGGTAAPGNAGTAGAGAAGGAGAVAVTGGGPGGNGGNAGVAGSPPATGPGGGGGAGGNPTAAGGAGFAGKVVLTWAGGSQTFTTPGTFQWTAPTGSPAQINMNVVGGVLNLFFHTGAPSEAGVGAHIFGSVFNPGTLSEQIQLAHIGPTSTASNARVDIQQLSDGANAPGVATGFLLYFDTAGGQHQLADWGQHGFGGLICQALVGAHPGTIDTTLAPETWQTLGLAAGFTAGTVTPQYRYEPVGTAGIVRLRGNFTLTANEPANTQFATLGSGYHPANNQFLVAGNNLSGATAVAADVSINTSGAMFITQAGSIGNEVILDGLTFPLD